MKEHLSGAEVRLCVAAGKGEGLSVKCQRFRCEAGLIKGGLVMGRWCGRNNALQRCHLMNEEPMPDTDEADRQWFMLTHALAHGQVQNHPES